jgi:hypothetical protein
MLNQYNCPSNIDSINICGKKAVIKSKTYKIKFYHGMVNDQGLGKTSYDYSESAGISELEILMDKTYAPHQYERGCSYNCPIVFITDGHMYTTRSWQVTASEPNLESGTVTLSIVSKDVISDNQTGLLAGFTYLKAV